MANKPQNNRFPGGFVAGAAAIALAAGVGAGWLAFNAFKDRPISSDQPQIEAPVETPADTTIEPTAPLTQTTQVYWLREEGVQFELVPSEVSLQQTSDDSQSLTQASLETLLNGPQNDQNATAIPTDTRLLGVEVDGQDIYVDLSSEFAQGGGSASMMGRLGQIIYTATAENPNGQVWLNVEGEPLEYLGGEGLIVEQPMTRESFDQNFQL